MGLSETGNKDTLRLFFCNLAVVESGHDLDVLVSELVEEGEENQGNGESDCRKQAEYRPDAIGDTCRLYRILSFDESEDCQGSV